MYAIVDIAGKQFKVEPESIIKVPLLDAEEGSEVKFDKVLMVRDGEKIEVGSPTLTDRSVKAKIIEHGRDKKIIVFKKKRRKDYKKKNGHRQKFTKVEIKEI